MRHIAYFLDTLVVHDNVQSVSTAVAENLRIVQ